MIENRPISEPAHLLPDEEEALAPMCPELTEVDDQDPDDATPEDDEEEDEEEEEEDEYADWDSSCLEDEELAFEGTIDEECLKEILFLMHQAVLLLRPELREASLKVVFYSGIEATEASPYLCEDESSKEILPLLGDLLTALILAADPVGCTFEYNDGPIDHPDGYSPYAEEISFNLEELGEVTAREILLSPVRLSRALLENGLDLKKFSLGVALMAQGNSLEVPIPSAA
jgi:hypothetical protein